MSEKIKNSKIEILKIFAMSLIVLSHVSQTLGAENQYISVHEYVLPLTNATVNLQNFFLSLLQYGGSFGNTIFFVCSCWFLLDSKKVSTKKIFYILADIWIISILILGIAGIAANRGGVNCELVIKSIFPTTFSNNWYMTCYMLFYAIHQVLNKIIYGMDESKLLKTCLILSFMYIFGNCIESDIFFSSPIIVWIAIYFNMAYMKLYLKKYAGSKLFHYRWIVFGISGNLGLVVVTNYLGLYFPLFRNRLLHWNRISNPFFIVAAIGLFNLANVGNYKNKLINSVSSLSFLVYIIHENILVRNYLRPLIFNYIYETFGYDFIYLWVLGLAVIILLISMAISWLYKILIQRAVKAFCDKMYIRLGILYGAVETYFLKIKENQ